ncbi:MAG: YqjF family protein [Acidimicrobiales bacterium]
MTAISPHDVRREVLRMWWRNLSFIHYEYEPADVQRLLPAGLMVDTYEGAAWVGLVPFEMEVLLPRGIPIPRQGSFPETNVRTYVHGPDGTPGVWFHSLEAGRLPATAVARATYGLPYYWAEMDATGAGPVWTYRSTRRWPGPRGACHASAVHVGESIELEEQSDLEVFLTARWGLYSTFRDRLLYAPVDHDPWPLRRATLMHLDDELISAAGLPRPEGSPLIHWSEGVEVRIGRPRSA